MSPVRVLVVEDEATAAEAHAAYVTRLPGFELAGVARSAAEAGRLIGTAGPVDLILLDLHLPDEHGLVLLRRLRAAGCFSDVIAVTSARDADVVRRAVAQGVVLYLVKPFTFAAFRAKLEQYAAYRAELDSSGQGVAQDEVDHLLASLRGPSSLPKGLSAETLTEVTQSLRTAAGGLSASEVAASIGTSRVTARRYLEHLADARVADRVNRYRGAGRPEVEYRWRQESSRPG